MTGHWTDWTRAPGGRLYGRSAERRAVGALLDRLHTGSGVLVVTGERGSGRTAVVEYAARSFDTGPVLRLPGGPPRARTPYGIVGALAAAAARADCGPPAETAAAPPPEALLALLRDMAARTPVLVCVDDAHLWDGASRTALAFAARRLDAVGRVGLVLSVTGRRAAGRDFGGLPAVRLDPLSLPAASALLDRTTGGDLHPAVRSELLDAADGSPALLTALARRLSPAELSGRRALPRPLADADLLTGLVGRLPHAGTARDAALLLTAAAALRVPGEADDVDAGVVLRAVADLTGGSHLAGGSDLTGGSEPAGSADTGPLPGQLDAADGRLRWSDTLVREAVYAAAAPDRRRAAHRALARVLEADGHRLVGLLHRAWSTTGPAPVLAAALADAATDAAEPGGHRLRAAAYARAAELTADGAARAARHTAAAEHAARAGRSHQALRFVAAADVPAAPAAVRARAELVRGITLLREGPMADARASLLLAASLLTTEATRPPTTPAASCGAGAGRSHGPGGAGRADDRGGATGRADCPGVGAGRADDCVAEAHCANGFLEWSGCTSDRSAEAGRRDCASAGTGFSNDPLDKPGCRGNRGAEAGLTDRPGAGAGHADDCVAEAGCASGRVEEPGCTGDPGGEAGRAGGQGSGADRAGDRRRAGAATDRGFAAARSGPARAAADGGDPAGPASVRAGRGPAAADRDGAGGPDAPGGHPAGPGGAGAVPGLAAWAAAPGALAGAAALAAADAAWAEGDRTACLEVLGQEGSAPAVTGAHVPCHDVPVGENAETGLLPAASPAPPTGTVTVTGESARVAQDLLHDYRLGMRAVLEARFDLAAGPLARVVERAGAAAEPEHLLRAVGAALLLGEVGTACRTGARALAAARTLDRAALVPQALEYLAYAELRAGRHAQARAHAEEGLRAAEATGQRNPAAHHHAVLALAASIEGDEAVVARHVAAALATARRHGLAQAAALAQWAAARADLGRGRPLEAADRLGPLVRPGPRRGHFAVWMLAVPCFVEAAVFSGRPDDARGVVEDFALWAACGADPQATAQLLRCRALLAAPDRADELFVRALAQHDEVAGDFEPARTELLYGKWLRRRRRLREARDRLGSALIALERCGARVWADQARAELRANGAAANGTRTNGTPASGADAGAGRAAGLTRLTPQQLRIARHVAEGATNREIARSLAVSTRTIDYHLRNVFALLGVRSRVELARLVEQAEKSGARL